MAETDLQNLGIDEIPPPLTEAPAYLNRLIHWISGHAENTRRTYAVAVRDFFAFTGMHPEEVKPADVAKWKEHLKEEHADSTVDHRLSALSSYFGELCEVNGNDPLIHFNPVKSVRRNDLDTTPYKNAKKISRDEYAKIMKQIDPTTPSGARDRAMIMFYTMCARRRSEIITLKFGDLSKKGESWYYPVQLKGGETRRKELPPVVMEEIQNYLKVANRKNPRPEDPLFVNHDHNHNMDKPITGTAIYQALREYAERAGIDRRRVSLHALRHLGADEFYKQSGDARETQKFLDHAKLETTEGYLSRMEGDKHEHWEEMYERLNGWEE